MNTRTIKGFKIVHGSDPQKLVEKIIRERIYESSFYRERCNTLDFDSILKLAEELTFIGGIYANTKPVPFLCLLQKLLQIQPSDELIEQSLNHNNKYVVALFSFYVRMVRSSESVFKTLEPFLNDFRKLRIKNRDGIYGLTTVDQFVDDLLVQDRVCDIILPRLTKRIVLEKNKQIEPLDIPEIELEEESIITPDGPRSKKTMPVEPEKTVGNGTSMSLEETNALRLKLGLRPLK